MKKNILAIGILFSLMGAVILSTCKNDPELPEIVLSEPTAPQNFTAAPGNFGVVLLWTAPLSNGGSDIIRYEVSHNDGEIWVTASSNTGHTFTGLANGTSYSFQVRAVNAVGNGTAASATAAPSLNTSVQRVFFPDAQETITLSGLANNDIFLVKVNTSDIIVRAENTGGSPGSSPGIFSGNILPASEDTFEIRMGHPGADEYHANPPPYVPKPSRESRGIFASSVSYTVGSAKSFWVETALNNNIWIQSQATLAAQGQYGNVWVMDDLTSFTKCQAQEMAEKFDIIYPVTTNLLGYEYGGGLAPDHPDYGGWDDDPRIQILVYDIGYDPAGTTIGYYWAKDMRRDLNNQGQPLSSQRSNEAEMFYMNGNPNVIDNFGIEVLYSTLVHEFQHLINYSRKSVANGVNSPTWYNEMLAMMAEDVVASFIGIDSTHTRHVIQSRIPRFLLNYYTSGGFTEWPSDGGVRNYQVTYAFGAYLLRNYGGAGLLKELLDNKSAGIDSVTAALNTIAGDGLSFEGALRRFGEVMVFSGPTMPTDVLSFDKTDTRTIGPYTYTATEFDVWNDFDEIRPGILYLTEQSDMRPHSILVHQASSGWTNQTGNVEITLQRPNNANVEFYLMIK